MDDLRERHRLAPYLTGAHRLVVEVTELTIRVVLLLQLTVCIPAVELPEHVRVVERRRVQRLRAAELSDFGLDRPVMKAVGRAAGQRRRSPEPDVHVGL